MHFEELPRDWAQRPITDPDVFEGVVDLIVPEQSRSDGATYLLLCHPNLHLLQPICLPDDPRRLDVGEVLEGVRLLLTEVSRHDVHDIAMGLHLSPKTVEAHRAHIKEKLNLPNAREVVRFATSWLVLQQSA